MTRSNFPRSLCLAALCGGAALLALSGCEEGSISDSSAYGSPSYVRGRAGGEINELDLLGSPAGASEGDIQGALQRQGRLPAPGSALLVVQSGAIAPDSLMLADLEKSYRVFPASGISPDDKPDAPRRAGALGRELRLAAARSGCTHVLCYWGKLESIREDGVTKTLSWVPIVGGLIPDEQRTTRLRVRAVVLDAASGRAATLSPPAAQNSAVSAGFARESSLDKQTIDLKMRAYAALAAQLAGG